MSQRTRRSTRNSSVPLHQYRYEIDETAVEAKRKAIEEENSLKKPAPENPSTLNKPLEPHLRADHADCDVVSVKSASSVRKKRKSKSSIKLKKSTIIYSVIVTILYYLARSTLTYLDPEPTYDIEELATNVQIHGNQTIAILQEKSQSLAEAYFAALQHKSDTHVQQMLNSTIERTLQIATQLWKKSTDILQADKDAAKFETAPYYANLYSNLNKLESINSNVDSKFNLVKDDLESSLERIKNIIEKTQQAEKNVNQLFDTATATVDTIRKLDSASKGLEARIEAAEKQGDATAEMAVQESAQALDVAITALSQLDQVQIRLDRSETEYIDRLDGLKNEYEEKTVRSQEDIRRMEREIVSEVSYRIARGTSVLVSRKLNWASRSLNARKLSGYVEDENLIELRRAREKLVEKGLIRESTVNEELIYCDLESNIGLDGDMGGLVGSLRLFWAVSRGVLVGDGYYGGHRSPLKKSIGRRLSGNACTPVRSGGGFFIFSLGHRVKIRSLGVEYIAGDLIPEELQGYAPVELRYWVKKRVSGNWKPLRHSVLRYPNEVHDVESLGCEEEADFVAVEVLRTVNGGNWSCLYKIIVNGDKV